MFHIDTIKQNDISSINKMLDQAFGVDRIKKAVYHLRDGVAAIPELSFVIRGKGVVIASLQFWPVMIRDGEAVYESLLLGPIAVRMRSRGQGVGLRLMKHGLVRAKKLGHDRVILVGDESYYRKVGFCRHLATGLEMPGLVDQHRLLAQELRADSLKNVKGLISRIK